jgi:uncharacterized membrane protein
MVNAPSVPATRWVGVAAFALSVIGIGISTYMTIAHFTEASILACSGAGELSCTAVTTSPQSRVFGIPVVLLGLGFFVVMSILTSPPIWRHSERWLALARSVLAVSGMIFVLWLVAAELLIIGHICLWCTGVHLVMTALLLVLTRATPAQMGFLVDDGEWLAAS